MLAGVILEKSRGRAWCDQAELEENGVMPERKYAPLSPRPWRKLVPRDWRRKCHENVPRSEEEAKREK